MPKADHMERISAEHLDELRKKHGRIKDVVYNGVHLVFRKPSRAEVQAHSVKSRSEDPNERAAADDQLAQLLIVRVGKVTEPREVKEGFLELLEDFPSLVACRPIGNALAQLSGVVQDDELKGYGAGSSGNDSTPTSTPKD